METEEKFEALKELLASYGSGAAAAFSGGVDSSFLLSVAKDVLGDRLLAVTVNADFVAQSEVDEASGISKLLGVEHDVITSDLADIENFTENPPDRCYFCKKHILEKIVRFAHGKGYDTVIEASNADDESDFRPGKRAIAELGVRSPLAETGFTKAEIRALARKRGLPNWDRPSNACLATRIKSGDEITRDKLEQIEKAEDFLVSLGFGQVRVRHHGALARIEVSPEEIERLFDEEARRRIDERLTDLGFIYITVDMEGYRSGSMDGRNT